MKIYYNLHYKIHCSNKFKNFYLKFHILVGGIILKFIELRFCRFKESSI